MGRATGKCETLVNIKEAKILFIGSKSVEHKYRDNALLFSLWPDKMSFLNIYNVLLSLHL